MVRDIFIRMRVLTNICKFSSQFASNYLDKTKWAESMGYLFCKRDGNRYIIDDAVGISRGGETYVTMTPEQLGQIELLEKAHPDCFLGGWWHTHPGLSPFYSDTDVLNQMFYQAGNEDGLGIVFDHSMVSRDFIGFKIFRLDDAQDPNTKYHDLEWKPIDWTEKDLEDAFIPIGVASRVSSALAFKLGVRNKPPADDLPPFIMPKVSSDSQAQQMIENCQKSSEAAFNKKDLIQALITKRIQVALLEKYGDNEDYADAIIEFLQWAMSASKFNSAEPILDRLEILIDDKKIPEDTLVYYTGKFEYIKGQIMQSQFQYGNAIEWYEKSIRTFQEEEYYEDCMKASFHIAECYDFQKELRKGIEWTDKSLQFGQKAIQELQEDDEEDEDGIAQLNAIISHTKGLQTRLKAKQAAQNTGATRII